MAALNQKETEQLRDACKALDYILRHGYDPKLTEAGLDPATPGRTQAIYTEKILKNTKSSVNAVVQMKGYYPN